MRIVVTGIGSRDMFRILEGYDPSLVQAQIMTDLAGARAVKKGQADYYFGACQSGQGGALAAAIAVLGYANTAMVGLPGRGADPARIAQAVERGAQAFGMSVDQIPTAVPLVVDLLLKNRQGHPGTPSGA